MTKVLWILVVSFLFSSLAFAAPSDFSISDQCFEDDYYCYEYGVKYNEELGRKVIRVDFYAQLFIDDYEDMTEIADLFLDFYSWDDYTAILDDYSSVDKALKHNDVVFVDSYGEDMVHTVHYWTTAPWPISKLEVKERSIYEEIEDDTAVLAYKFYLDKTYNNDGLKYKTGVLKLFRDDEEGLYYAVVSLDVIPEIDFLPSVAAPYVTKGLVAIFKGMFDM